MGAYFSLLAYKDEDIKNSLFLSPVVNMKVIIDNMMLWSNTTEKELEEKQEIKTNFGQTLYWDYYKYVKENPIVNWNKETFILYGSSETYKSIFIYQSMSGDADEGTSTFTAKDSKIINNKGEIIFVTNTSTVIELENNEIINNDKDGNFMKISSAKWGKSGSNGGTVTLNAKNQKIEGNILVDNISTLDLSLKNGSNYEGTINNENTAKSLKITLDSSSSITLTGDSYITSLENADATNSNINFNGYKLYVNGTAIN